VWIQLVDNIVVSDQEKKNKKGREKERRKLRRQVVICMNDNAICCTDTRVCFKFGHERKDESVV
jgi:hypothetical protein